MNHLGFQSEHMFADDALLVQVQEYLRLCREKGRPGEVLAAAWGDFYLIEDARLRGFAVHLREDQRDDVVQQVWQEIVVELDGFQGDRAVEQLHCWMSKVVRTKAAALFRDLDRHPTRSLNGLPEGPEDCRGGISAGQEKAKWLGEVFLIWLEELRAKQAVNAELMRGRFVDRRGIAELAAALGMTVPVARGRLKRQKKLFRVWASRRLDDSA